MTLPEGTVALLCMVTVPTVSVAPVSAAVAAACVRPTTFGTAAEGRAFVAVVSVLLQPKSRQTQITPSAPRCQCDCLMNLNLAPLGCSRRLKLPTRTDNSKFNCVLLTAVRPLP